MELINSVGNTPLLFLKTISIMTGCRVYLKYEAGNPFGASADRIASFYMRKGVASGQVRPDGSVILASAGSLAVSLAYFCASLHVTLFNVMPMPKEKNFPDFLRQLKAEVILTPAEKGMKGAKEKADFLHTDIWNSYYCNQFQGEENALVHYNGTGEEIIRQCEEVNIIPDYFISGRGSGATICGAGIHLKEKYPDIKLVAVSPFKEESENPCRNYLGMESEFSGDFFEDSYVDFSVNVPLKDAIQAMRHLLYKDGIPGGISTGANLKALLELSRKKENKGKTYVIMCHSGMERDLLIHPELFNQN